MHRHSNKWPVVAAPQIGCAGHVFHILQLSDHFLLASFVGITDLSRESASTRQTYMRQKPCTKFLEATTLHSSYWLHVLEQHVKQAWLKFMLWHFLSCWGTHLLQSGSYSCLAQTLLIMMHLIVWSLLPPVLVVALLHRNCEYCCSWWPCIRQETPQPKG